MLVMMNRRLVPDSCTCCMHCKRKVKHKTMVGSSVLNKLAVHYNKQMRVGLSPTVHLPMELCTMMVQCTIMLDRVSLRHRSKQWQVQPRKRFFIFLFVQHCGFKEIIPFVFIQSTIDKQRTLTLHNLYITQLRFNILITIRLNEKKTNTKGFFIFVLAKEPSMLTHSQI